MKASMCTLAAVLAVASLGVSSASAEETNASYRLTFVPTWTAETHPLDYPSAAPRMAHFPPIIGATHDDRYAIFTPETAPTPGLERLSERGKHDPLDAEIRDAIDSGRVGALIQTTQPIQGNVFEPAAVTFEIQATHPLVSAVAMLAPSPDWFAGVSAVRLHKNGGWLPTVTTEAFAWDSGGDGGETYLAEDADADPKGVTRLSDGPHFVQSGVRVPVGVFVFTRLPSS